MASNFVNEWFVADISVKYPRFLGSGYLALSPLRSGFDQLTAVIVCRPETNNGLLLLNTDSVDAKHDFFSVAFVDGRAVFTYVTSHLLLLKLLPPPPIPLSPLLGILPIILGFGDRLRIWGFCQVILGFLLALKQLKFACILKVYSHKYGITKR